MPPKISVTGLDDETFANRLLQEEHVAAVPVLHLAGGRGICTLFVCHFYEKIEEALFRIERLSVAVNWQIPPSQRKQPAPLPLAGGGAGHRVIARLWFLLRSRQTRQWQLCWVCADRLGMGITFWLVKPPTISQRWSIRLFMAPASASSATRGSIGRAARRCTDFSAISSAWLGPIDVMRCLYPGGV